MALTETRVKSKDQDDKISCTCYFVPYLTGCFKEQAFLNDKFTCKWLVGVRFQNGWVFFQSILHACRTTN
jgi:hypothetical protein